jgi:hypothetical protein
MTLTVDQAQETLSSLGDEDKAKIKPMFDFILTLLNGVEEESTNWEEFYEFMDSAIRSMIEQMKAQNLPNNLTEFSTSIIAVSLVKGYADFRRSQPTMTDFDLAKIIIFEYVRNDLMRGANEIRKIVGV